MTLDNNINSVDQLSQQASGNSSFRKVPAPLLTVQYTPVQLNLESINIATPLTPHIRQNQTQKLTIPIRPKSGQKRNKLNAATQGLILPKSHNKFDLHLKPADSEDASTDFGDSDKSPTSQDEQRFVSWQSILSALQPSDLVIDDCPSYLNHDFEGQPQGAPRSLSNNFYESPIKNFLFPRGQVIETAQGQESCQTIPTLYNNRVRGSSQ
eukprot:403355490